MWADDFLNLAMEYGQDLLSGLGAEVWAWAWHGHGNKITEDIRQQSKQFKENCQTFSSVEKTFPSVEIAAEPRNPTSLSLKCKPSTSPI